MDESQDPKLTAFQRDLLTVLADEPRYGLAIKRELESYYGEDVNHGRLYPNLDDLVEMGYVEKGEIDKRTNRYELTEAGQERIVDRVEWMVKNITTDESEHGVSDLTLEYS